MVACKKKFCFILMLMVLLTGCANHSIKETEYVTKPVTVYVPIMELPAIKPIPKPSLEVKSLTDTSSPASVAEAYYNSLQQMIRYSNLLEKALNPFYEEYKKQNGTQSVIQQ